mgnify:FL=1
MFCSVFRNLLLVDITDYSLKIRFEKKFGVAIVRAPKGSGCVFQCSIPKLSWKFAKGQNRPIRGENRAQHRDAQIYLLSKPSKSLISGKRGAILRAFLQGS